MFTQIINKVAFAANTDKRYISDDICFMTVRLPVSVIVIVIVIVTFVFFGIAGRSILVSRFAAAFPLRLCSFPSGRMDHTSSYDHVIIETWAFSTNFNWLVLFGALRVRSLCFG